MIHKIGTLGQYGGPILVDRIVANSVTMGVGYSVKTASGFAALGTAGAMVLGHVVNIAGDNGLAPALDGTFLGNLGSTFAAASDNQTVAKVRVIVDVSQNSLYSAEVDAAIGTTTGSNLAGYRMDLADKDTLDESTAVATTAQYYSHGVDRNNTAQAIVNIHESEIFGA